MKTCPCCGQSLPDERPLGLRLARSTTRLLELVIKAGKHGIPTDILFDRLYADDPNGGPETGIGCMQVRIWQLNRRLRTVGKEIRAIDNPGRGGYGRYVLRNVR